ncbi:hypothetical protein D9M71_801110 [compost metagenome]
MPGIYPDLQLLGTALQQGQAARSVIGGAAEQVEYQQLKQTCERRGMQEGDYRLFPPMRDEHSQYLPPKKNKRPLVLQRITDNMMRTVQPFQAIAAMACRSSRRARDLVQLRAR